MPQIQARTGPQTPKDFTWPEVRGGPWGELSTSDMSGFFAEHVARGNGYCFSSALAGVACIATTNTTANQLIYGISYGSNTTTSANVYWVFGNLL